jgi:CubicO group peptidase (beta-lactamase class C family)
VPTDEPKPLPDDASLAEALAYYDDFLAFQQRYLRIPGVQAAVRTNGSLRLSTAHGLADVEREIALTTEHLFRVASHSKTFTAVATMQLVEAGTLRLDDTAGRWVPQLEGSPLVSVTVRELLTHAGGVWRDSATGDFWQLVGRFPDEPRLIELLVDPGASVIPRNDRFKYSNIGYSLSGLIVAAASGTSFNDYTRQNIVERLGLGHTGPDYDATRADEYVVGYTAYSYADRRVPVDDIETGAMAAATGFFSRAEDLTAYFSAHCFGDERLLSDESKRQMQNQTWGRDKEGGSYGLGLQVIEAGERTLHGHGGGWPGQITRSLVDTQQGLAISVLTNAVDGAAEPLARAGFTLIDLAGSKPRPDGAGDLQRFTGRFAHLFGVTDVAVLGGRLYSLAPAALDPAADATLLEVVDERTLRIAGGSGGGAYGEPITYTFGDDGDVETVSGWFGVTLRPVEQLVLPERITLRDA